MYFCTLMALLLLASSFVHSPVPTIPPVQSRETEARLPDAGGAYVLFAGKFGGEVTPQEIASQTELAVDGCARGARIFEVTLSVTKSGQTSTWTHNSHVLTPDMRAQLKSLTKGDVFEFQKTKAYLGNTSDVVNVHGRKFVVVQGSTDRHSGE